MDKAPFPKIVSALALSLAAYLAHYEFESIKNDQKQDRITMNNNAEKLNQVQSDVRILLERSTQKLPSWSTPERPPARR